MQLQFDLKAFWSMDNNSNFELFKLNCKHLMSPIFSWTNEKTCANIFTAIVTYSGIVISLSDNPNLL
jgi:hypothetical protein